MKDKKFIVFGIYIDNTNVIDAPFLHASFDVYDEAARFVDEGIRDHFETVDPRSWEIIWES
jgi:hypothetical protein